MKGAKTISPTSPFFYLVWVHIQLQHRCHGATKPSWTCYHIYRTILPSLHFRIPQLSVHFARERLPEKVTALHPNLRPIRDPFAVFTPSIHGEDLCNYRLRYFHQNQQLHHVRSKKESIATKQGKLSS
jgi:hypothetical protein